MTSSASGFSRRLFLAAASAAALLPTPAWAQEGGQGIRFSFSIKEHPFGATITVLGKALLLTVRSLKDSAFRASTVFTPKGKDESTSASVEFGKGNLVTASIDKAGKLTIKGTDVTLTSVAMHPESDKPPPDSEGLFGWLGKVASGIGNLVTSAIGLIGAAGAWLLGISINWRNGWGSIQVFRDGSVWITIWGSEGAAGGFMAPPPGTEDTPGVWY